MNRLRSVSVTFVTVCLLLQAGAASARLMQVSLLQQQQTERSGHWKTAAHTEPLPALNIELCATCSLSREELSAINKGYTIAAHAAGNRIDALSPVHVKIVETGTLANGAPYAKGETGGMWFRVGNPRPGESIGTIAGHLTFVILSGAR